MKDLYEVLLCFLVVMIGLSVTVIPLIFNY